MADGFAITPGAGVTIAGEELDVGDGTQQQQICQVYSKRWEATYSPTVNTTAYSAGMTIGTVATITNAARVAGQATMIETLSVIDLHQQMPALDILFFRDSITTPTDHATFAPSDADIAKFRGGVSVASSDYSNLSTNAVASLIDIGLVIPNLVGTSLYMVVVARSAPDFAAGTDFSVNVGGVRL